MNRPLLLLLLLSILLLGSAKVLNRALTKILKHRNADGLLQPFASALAEINRFKENKLFIMDQITCSAAMNICIEQKRGLDGLSLYNDLFVLERRIEVKPDRITYGMAMSCCVLTSNAVLANTLLAQCDSHFILGSSLKFRDQDLVILAMCMAANALVNDWATIKAHFKMLTRSRGMRPSASILESTLRACKNTQDKAQWAVVESYIDVLQVGNAVDGDTAQKVVAEKSNVLAPISKPLLVAPTLAIYAVLLRYAGRQGDSALAFRYYADLVSKGLLPDRMVMRELVEATSLSKDSKGTEQARQMLQDRFGSLRLVTGTENAAPSASFTLPFSTSIVTLNNMPGPSSAAVRKLAALAKHTFILSSLPQQGTSIASDETKRELLLHHCEKQALAVMIGTIGQKGGGIYPPIAVNLCMCADCHAFFRATSLLLGNKEIICQDPKRMHIFMEGVCSCKEMDY